MTKEEEGPYDIPEGSYGKLLLKYAIFRYIIFQIQKFIKIY